VEYTNLGPTGLTVSRICLGMMSYGEPGRDWVLDEDAARPLVRRAAEAGIITGRKVGPPGSSSTESAPAP